MNICVLTRVYDRIEDLIHNVSIIKDTWKTFNYDLLVVSNGSKFGYSVPQEVRNDASVIELTENVGHLKGNSQLLMEGYNHIDFNKYDYVIILEADTWIYSDEIIKKYISKLESSSAVWASALWYDRFYSLATDFAIIKASFLENNKQIFDFEDYPECYVCNYILDRGLSYLHIKENMPVMVPSYVPRFPYAPYGRFYVFPFSGMVTHHIEHIEGGMESKKYYFNVIAKSNYFKIKKNIVFGELFKMKVVILLTYLLPRRTWYSKRRKFQFDNL